MRRPQRHDQGPTKEVDPAEDAMRRCLPKTYLVGRIVYSDFNTVFVPLLLLAAGVGFPAACF